MTFVIRSMSTTDFRPAYRGYNNVLVPAQQPVPYHCYLMPVEKRRGAFWNRSPMDAMVFETEADAQAEIDRYGLNTPYVTCDVAPADHEQSGFPTFWDRREAARAA